MGRRAAITALLVAAALPQPAVAQDEGVFFDPGTPAGKEYALPLEQARREASGHGGSSLRDFDALPGRPAGRPPPLFGEGITRRGRSDRRTRDRSPSRPQAARVTAPGALDGADARLRLGAVALAVVAAGLGAGALLRRRGSRSGPLE